MALITPYSTIYRARETHGEICWAGEGTYKAVTAKPVSMTRPMASRKPLSALLSPS